MLAGRRAKSSFNIEPMDQIVKRNGNGNKGYAAQFVEWVNNAVQCPERFLTALPGDLPPKIAEWTRNGDRRDGLYVFGGVGTGKTHALYALAKLLRANGVEARVRNIPDWLDYLRSKFDDKRAERGIEDELRGDCVLLLDDLGSEKQTEWTTEIMYRLVNGRYEQARPTIFSSNLSLSEVSKRYGDRITSRIVQMVGGSKGIIKTDGEDRRLKN